MLPPNGKDIYTEVKGELGVITERETGAGTPLAGSTAWLQECMKSLEGFHIYRCFFPMWRIAGYCNGNILGSYPRDCEFDSRLRLQQNLISL